MKTNKNEVYVLKQPSHVNMSIIMVDCENYPLTDNVHLRIEELKTFSDVIFIFSDKFFPNSKKINKDKFSNLYGASAWIETDNSLPATFMKILKYSKEIFETEIGYIITSVEKLSHYSKLTKARENIEKITMSAVSRPIFKIDRLSSLEFYDIYFEDKPKITVKKRLENLLKKESKKPNNINMYCSYYSTSDLIYFKNVVANLYLDFYKNDDTKNYVESFSERYDLSYLLASLTKYIGIDAINESINEMDLGESL